jgi:Tfp pilus assembly protein PilX
MKLKRENSEGGFVLIVALMGIMILLAVGFFALTVSTKDLRIAARLLGERKAFSAAESGVQAVTGNYQSAPSLNNTGTSNDCNAIITSCNNAHWIPIDPDDPNTCYCVYGSTDIAGLPQVCTSTFSIEGGMSWHCKNYQSTVTGRDTAYNSKVSIAVGVKGKAAPDSPGYDFN